MRRIVLFYIFLCFTSVSASEFYYYLLPLNSGDYLQLNRVAWEKENTVKEYVGNENVATRAGHSFGSRSGASNNISSPAVSGPSQGRSSESVDHNKKREILNNISELDEKIFEKESDLVRGERKRVLSNRVIPTKPLADFKWPNKEVQKRKIAAVGGVNEDSPAPVVVSLTDKKDIQNSVTKSIPTGGQKLSSPSFELTKRNLNPIVLANNVGTKQQQQVIKTNFESPKTLSPRSDSGDRGYRRASKGSGDRGYVKESIESGDRGYRNDESGDRGYVKDESESGDRGYVGTPKESGDRGYKKEIESGDRGYQKDNSIENTNIVDGEPSGSGGGSSAGSSGGVENTSDTEDKKDYCLPGSKNCPSTEEDKENQKGIIFDEHEIEEAPQQGVFFFEGDIKSDEQKLEALIEEDEVYKQISSDLFKSLYKKKVARENNLKFDKSELLGDSQYFTPYLFADTKKSTPVNVVSIKELKNSFKGTELEKVAEENYKSYQALLKTYKNNGDALKVSDEEFQEELLITDTIETKLYALNAYLEFKKELMKGNVQRQGSGLFYLKLDKKLQEPLAFTQEEINNYPNLLENLIAAKLIDSSFCSHLAEGERAGLEKEEFNKLSQSVSKVARSSLWSEQYVVSVDDFNHHPLYILKYFPVSAVKYCKNKSVLNSLRGGNKGPTGEGDSSGNGGEKER